MFSQLCSSYILTGSLQKANNSHLASSKWNKRVFYILFTDKSYFKVEWRKLGFLCPMNKS